MPGQSLVVLQELWFTSRGCGGQRTRARTHAGSVTKRNALESVTAQSIKPKVTALFPLQVPIPLLRAGTSSFSPPPYIPPSRGRM